jgi:hypothetical protein
MVYALIKVVMRRSGPTRDAVRLSGQAFAGRNRSAPMAAERLRHRSQVDDVTMMRSTALGTLVQSPSIVKNSQASPETHFLPHLALESNRTKRHRQRSPKNPPAGSAFTRGAKSCERSHCAGNFQLSKIRPTKSPPAGDIGCGRTYRDRVYCRTDADSTEPFLPRAPPSLRRPLMLALRRKPCHTSTPLTLFV